MKKILVLSTLLIVVSAIGQRRPGQRIIHTVVVAPPYFTRSMSPPWLADWPRLGFKAGDVVYCGSESGTKFWLVAPAGLGIALPGDICYIFGSGPVLPPPVCKTYPVTATVTQWSGGKPYKVVVLRQNITICDPPKTVQVINDPNVQQIARSIR